MIAAPTPSYTQREEIAEARARVALAVERRIVDQDEAATTWAAYNDACAAAGVRTPPDWRLWPKPTDIPHPRSLSERTRTSGQSGRRTQGAPK